MSLCLSNEPEIEQEYPPIFKEIRQNIKLAVNNVSINKLIRNFYAQF
jgi:hypothetical protein